MSKNKELAEKLAKRLEEHEPGLIYEILAAHIKIDEVGPNVWVRRDEPFYYCLTGIGFKPIGRR